MFIVKLVCDKCGTEASTCDKFCRECGTKGTLGKVSTPDDLEMVRCRSCGEEFDKAKTHKCSGVLGVTGPKEFYGELRVEQEVSTKSVQLGSREICETCMQYVRTDIAHTCLNGEKAWCNNVKGVVKWRG